MYITINKISFETKFLVSLKSNRDRHGIDLPQNCVLYLRKPVLSNSGRK